MKKLLILLFTVLSFFAQAQDYQAELGFKYVKADYLAKTQRFDEAIKELNDVIKDNPSYENALLLRGDLKFMLAAYKESKLDALQSIELKGITKEAAALLGRSEYALGNFEIAERSLLVAYTLGSIDEKVILELADIAVKSKKNESACKYWQIAAKNGSSTANINLSKFCGGVPINPSNTELVNNTTSSNGSTTGVPIANPSQESNTSLPKVDSTAIIAKDSLNAQNTGPIVSNFPTRPSPVEDDTPLDIEIDEDLSITIMGQGLGKRKILEKPSILILSEKDGVVAIEVCINENGRVESAEFNQSKSTIENKGLVSLAIRKSKEFWFEKSDFLKQCGFIFYKVKGS
jgi:tetratricopeptide (TPR) repeat protein